MTIVVSDPSGVVISQPTMARLAGSIARWLNRTDLADAIPDFVTTAESEIETDSRLRATFQVTTGTGAMIAGIIALPTDMLELRALSVNGVHVRELTPQDFARSLRIDVFKRSGETIEVIGKPDGNWELEYLAKLPALVFDTDSNWLLREHFDVYLWKCCEIGSIYLRDPDGASGYQTKYEQAASRIQGDVMEHRWGGASREVSAPGVV